MLLLVSFIANFIVSWDPLATAGNCVEFEGTNHRSPGFEILPQSAGFVLQVCSSLLSDSWRMEMSQQSHPEVFSWKRQGFRPRVRDQGATDYCAPCASAVVIEGMEFSKTRKSLDLSEQQLIDRYKDCSSGVVYTDFLSHFKDFPCMTTRDNYPLNANYVRQPYKLHQVIDPRVCVQRWKQVTPPAGEDIESTLIGAVTRQPVFAMIAASEDFMDYEMNDVYTNPNTGELNHAVVIMGYGICKKSKHPYWLVLSSWGTDFATKGYIRMLRGVNLCGIEHHPYIPIPAHRIPELPIPVPNAREEVEQPGPSTKRKRRRAKRRHRH